MPNKKHKKKTVTYTPETLQKALTEIRAGLIKIREASRKFGIPRCTIQDRLSGRRTDELKKQGPEPVLGEQGEKNVVEWLIKIAKSGFPVKKQELLDSVQKILKDLKKPNPFKDDRPGQTWYLNFLKRHPEISVRSAEGINNARARVTEESIRLWFRELETFLAQEGHSDILTEPERIFNGDESGFSLCPKTGKVLGPKGYRNLYQIKAGNEKENLTVLVTFNATGNMCPPLVVFPYIRPPKSVTDSMPEDWVLGRSESGWMNGDVFFEYITNDFNNWIMENKIKKPVLLLVDGHRSHMSLMLSTMCEELGIILYALPPNTTHMLQPADVSVFAPLKAQWKSHVRKFLAEPENLNKTVTKTNFCRLFKDVIENPQMKTNIVNGFRRCGLFPYDPNAVDYTKCVQNTLEQFSRPTGSSENSGITNEDLIATRKVIRHLRPVLKQKKINTKCILQEVKKLRRPEPREPQYITGSEDNTNSTLEVSGVPNLLSNVSAHTSASASDLAPLPHISDPNLPHVSDVNSANVTDLAPSHIHDPVPVTLVIAAEGPDRTSESVPNHGLSNLVTSDFSGLELGTMVSLDDIVVIPFQTSTPKNRNLSPTSLVPNGISPSSKPDSNNVPLCTEQVHKIQIIDETGSLEISTGVVPHSSPNEQLGSENRGTDSVTLSQVPTLKDNLPLCTVSTSENLSEDINEILTFGVNPKQPEGRSLSLDDLTVNIPISERSDSHEVLSKKAPSSTVTSASTKNKISINPNTVFKQHLFIPPPLEKSKTNVSKARLPSAISGQKWREYHLLKEKAKQEEIEQKEKAKEARKQAAKRRQAEAKRRQAEAKKKKEMQIAKKLRKGTLLKTKNLASKQNIKQSCGKCANILNSDTEDDENKNIGCDFCNKWFHLKCTDFIGLAYDGVKDIPFKCNMCIIDKELETSTEVVPHSSPQEILGSQNHDTDLVTLSQVPTSKDNLPLCTVTISENLLEAENEILTFGVTREQPEGRSQAKQEKNEEKENANVGRKQAVKRKQEEAKKNKGIQKAKKLKKGIHLKNQTLASKQNIKQSCGQCANILNSDTEDDENKNVGCDFCSKWFHLKCTHFVGLTYDDVKDISFMCNMCIINKE